MAEFDRLSTLLNEICIHAAQITNATASSLYLKESNVIRLIAAFGYSSILAGKSTYEFGEGITGWIAQGHDFMANSEKDIREHPKWRGKYDSATLGDYRLSCNGMIGVPLQYNSEIIGLIKVETPRCGPFTETNRLDLKQLAKKSYMYIAENEEYMRRSRGINVLVLMPFDKSFDNIYQFEIKSPLEELAMNCHRIDEVFFKDEILTQIYDYIKRSDYIVADMTGRNANVYYEVGYAHALDKNVTLLTQHISDIPFSLHGHAHIEYQPDNLKGLSDDLRRRILAFVTGKYHE